jgi:hypothetical protein
MENPYFYGLFQNKDINKDKNQKSLAEFWL